MCYGYCVVDSTVEGNVDEVVVDYAAADCVGRSKRCLRLVAMVGYWDYDLG
jgi:hypothetical protein